MQSLYLDDIIKRVCVFLLDYEELLSLSLVNLAGIASCRSQLSGRNLTLPLRQGAKTLCQGTLWLG